jgi:hypothetical protein
MSSFTNTSNSSIVSHKKVKILSHIETDNTIYFYVFPCLFYPFVLCIYANICGIKISEHKTWSIQSMLFPQRQRVSHIVRNKIFKSNHAASCNLILWYTSSYLQTLYVCNCYSHAVSCLVPLQLSTLAPQTSWVSRLPFHYTGRSLVDAAQILRKHCTSLAWVAAS